MWINFICLSITASWFRLLEVEGDKYFLAGKYQQAYRSYSSALRRVDVDKNLSAVAVLIFKKSLSLSLGNSSQGTGDRSCRLDCSVESLFSRKEISLMEKAFEEEPSIWKKFLPVLKPSTAERASLILIRLGVDRRSACFLNSAVRISRRCGLDDCEVLARKHLEKIAPSYENEVSLGKLLYRKGKYAEALKYLRKALTKDFNGEASLYMAFCFSKMDDLSLAERYAEKALTKRKEDPVTLTFAGTVYRKLGEFKKAERLLKRAVACSSGKSRSIASFQLALVYYDLGVKNYNLGKDDEAMVYFDRCSRLVGKDNFLYQRCAYYISRIKRSELTEEEALEK